MFLRRYFANSFKSKTVCFYPEKPEHRNVIYKILCNLGYRITKNPQTHFDLIMNWQDATFRRKDPILNELNKKSQVVNINCDDISKHNIEQIFSKVFNYSVAIDPEKYSGKCVKKSNLNADSKRGKELVNCPIKREEDFSYEKLIESANADGKLVDFRVPIFKNKIPLVYKRAKEKSEIFSDGIHPKLTIENPTEIFSKSEIKKILDFSKKIGLDYGEIDILRDRKDKKIYIVDVNTTPFGLHNVPADFRKKALDKLSRKFKEQFFA